MKFLMVMIGLMIATCFFGASPILGVFGYIAVLVLAFRL